MKDKLRATNKTSGLLKHIFINQNDEIQFQQTNLMYIGMYVILTWYRNENNLGIRHPYISRPVKNP